MSSITVTSFDGRMTGTGGELTRLAGRTVTLTLASPQSRLFKSVTVTFN